MRLKGDKNLKGGACICACRSLFQVYKLEPVETRPSFISMQLRRMTALLLALTLCAIGTGMEETTAVRDIAAVSEVLHPPMPLHIYKKLRTACICTRRSTTLCAVRLCWCPPSLSSPILYLGHGRGDSCDARQSGDISCAWSDLPRAVARAGFGSDKRS